MLSRLAGASLFLAAASTATARPLQVEIAGDACNLDGLAAEMSSTSGHVRVETSQAADGVGADIWFPDHPAGQRGPRSVAAADCAQLVDAIALVIAMALPGDEVHRPIAATPDDATLAVHEVMAVTRPRVLAIDGYVTGGTTIAGGTRGQLIVGARMVRGAYSLGVEARADVPEIVETSDVGGVRVSRAELAVSGCRHLGSLGACASASGGTIRGQGIGLDEARSAHTPVVTTGLGLVWEHELVGPIAVRAFLEARALLTSSTFDVDHMAVWQSQRFEGSGGLGLLAHFL